MALRQAHFVFVLSEPFSKLRPIIPTQALPIPATTVITPHACMR